MITKLSSPPPSPPHPSPPPPSGGRAFQPDYTAGDCILLRQRDSGAEFPALVVRVTKGRRLECVWQRRERSGRGHMTRPALLDDRRFEIIGPAPADQADHLRRLA